MGMFNTGANYLTAEQMEELRRRGLINTSPSYQANPAVDNATPNTPAANPSIRRIVSSAQQAGDDAAGAISQNPDLARYLNEPKPAPDYSAAQGAMMQSPDLSRYTGGTMPQQPAAQPTAASEPEFAYGGGRIDPNASTGGMGIPTDSQHQKTQTEIEGDRIRDAIDMPANVNRARQRSGLSRMFRGMGTAWRNYRGGGLLNLVGDMLDQGINEGVHPSERAQRVKDEGLARMFRPYQQHMAMDAEQQKLTSEHWKAMKEQGDYMRAANKPLYDSITADDIVTPEEAAMATAAGFPMEAYDARQFDTQQVNGQYRSAPKKGAPNYLPNPTLPVDQGKVVRDTTIETPSGNVTLPLTASEAAHTLVSAQERAERAAQRVAENEQRAADKEYSDEKDYRSEVRSWTERQNKAHGQKQKAEKALKSLKESREQLVQQQFDTSQVDKQIADYEGDIAEADELLKEKKPKKIIRRKTTTSKGGKNDNVGTEDSYQKALKRLRGH